MENQDVAAAQVNGPTEIITKELLESSLKAATGAEKVIVLDFTTKSGSKKGDNYASVINAVEVKAKVGGSDKVQSFRFIVKEIPDNPGQRKFLEQAQLFPKEIQTYTILMPAMVEVQRHFGVKEPLKIAAPQLYSTVDQTDCLVFEDLCQFGYKMANKYTGLDYDHCRLAMKELGKFHGLSYGLKLRASKPLEEEYPFLEDFMMNGKMTEMFAPFYENSYTNAMKTVGDVDSDLAEKMKSLQGNIFKTCIDTRKNSEGLDLILHGDFWVNNMIFKYEKRGQKDVPVDIKFLDFQVVRVGSPTLDLSYFFYNSTTYDLRRNHLKDLLKLYHETFTSTIDSMGLDFPEFTFQRLQDKFDKDRLFGYFFACMALPLMMARPGDALDMGDLDAEMADEKMMEEFKTRMEDSLLKMKDNKHFHERLRGIVLDIQDAGLI